MDVWTCKNQMKYLIYMQMESPKKNIFYQKYSRLVFTITERERGNESNLNNCWRDVDSKNECVCVRKSPQEAKPGVERSSTGRRRHLPGKQNTK
jgi:hypothetical protein